jgi:hypothetical protein
MIVVLVETLTTVEVKMVFHKIRLLSNLVKKYEFFHYSGKISIKISITVEFLMVFACRCELYDFRLVAIAGVSELKPVRFLVISS